MRHSCCLCNPALLTCTSPPFSSPARLLPPPSCRSLGPRKASALLRAVMRVGGFVESRAQVRVLSLCRSLTPCKGQADVGRMPRLAGLLPAAHAAQCSPPLPPVELPLPCTALRRCGASWACLVTECSATPPPTCASAHPPKASWVVLECAAASAAWRAERQCKCLGWSAPP